MKYVDLGQLVKIQKGKKLNEVYVKSADTVRYIQIEDLRNDENIKYTSSDLKSAKCDKNDILIAWDGANAGTIGFGLEGAIGSTLAKLTPIKEFFTPFVGRFLQSKFTYLRSSCTGATIPHISKSVLTNIQIPLPPLPEQKRIAEILDKADALRLKNKQLLYAYDELLQATFLDMFGDPVMNPKGWKKEELSEVIKIKHGYAFKSKYFANEGGFILLTPGNFKEQGGFREQKKQKYYIGDFPQDYILKPQDLLLAMTEQAVGLLGSALFVPNKGVYLHNQRLGLVKYLIEINPTFLYFIFNHPSTREQIQKGATGTKVRHTSPGRIVQIKTLLPPIALQNQFAQIVENIDAQKTLVKLSLRESENLFNGLVQKAFGGEL